MAKADDCGDYYRIKADNRDLNYAKYFTDGEELISRIEDYNSHNTRRMDVDEVKELLLQLDFIKSELAAWCSL
jgi:UDP-glucose 4-epimerase